MTLSDKAYNYLKFIALVLLPAVGTLYFAVAGIWSLPSAEQVVGTITAVDTFLGGLLHVSTASYNKSDAAVDGTLAYTNKEDSSEVRLQNVDVAALATKDSVTFKIQRDIQQ